MKQKPLINRENLTGLAQHARGLLGSFGRGIVSPVYILTKAISTDKTGKRSSIKKEASNYAEGTIRHINTSIADLSPTSRKLGKGVHCIAFATGILIPIAISAGALRGAVKILASQL